MFTTRRYILQLAFILLGLFYAGRLYVLQVSSEDYKLDAHNNSIRRVSLYPHRGLVYDRDERLIMTNQSVFDVKVIPADFSPKDSTLLNTLLGLPPGELQQRLDVPLYRRRRPVTLIKQLSPPEYARVQDRLAGLQGVLAEPRSIRKYPHENLGVTLGYVKEVDRAYLNGKNNTNGYYRPGDLIGRTGIEEHYEAYLRGLKGTEYLNVDVRGRVKGPYKAGKYDTLPYIGSNLQGTLDLELQAYGEKLMQNKVGAIVAIEPETGEILAMISAPTYDPNLLTGEGKQVTRNFLALQRDPNKPLFNRAAMAAYPPGSTFKVVEALLGLQEEVVTPERSRIACIQDVFKCHAHGGSSDISGSIIHSCNPYYLKVFYRLVEKFKNDSLPEEEAIYQAYDAWRNRVMAFGVGKTLSLDIPHEKRGLLPSVEYYNRKFKRLRYRWRLSNIHSLSIGQGELSLTPLQMANIAAVVANKGHYIAPHLVRSIEEKKLPDSLFQKNFVNVDKQHFDLVTDAMARVVRHGTATRAFIPDIEVCGKTGTCQNPHGENHSAFIAFAPRENPKIAIAVFVENAGYGGTWAAPIASLMIEKYIHGEIRGDRRLWEEKRIMEAQLIQTQEERNLRYRKRKYKEKRRPTAPENPKPTAPAAQEALPTAVLRPQLELDLE